MDSKHLKQSNSTALQIHKILQPRRQNAQAKSSEENRDPIKCSQERIKLEPQEKSSPKLTTSLTVTAAGSTVCVAVPKSKKGVITMAKRNARERNRVKQVNQGYVTLLHHIPEGFRQRKMSKVQTLKSAVDYIMSLQMALNSNDSLYYSCQDLQQVSTTESDNMESLDCLLSSSVDENNINMYEDESASSVSGISFEDQGDLDHDYVYNDPDLDKATCFAQISEMELVQENQESKQPHPAEVTPKEPIAKTSLETINNDEIHRQVSKHIKIESV